MVAVLAHPEERRQPSGGALRAAAAVVTVEGVALVALSLGYAAYGVVGAPHSLAGVAGEAVLGVGTGALLCLLARALRRRARWAVTPTLLLQLLCLPVAWGLAQGHLWGYAAALAGPAILTIALLFTPSGRAVMRGEG